MSGSARSWMAGAALLGAVGLSACGGGAENIVASAPSTADDLAGDQVCRVGTGCVVDSASDVIITTMPDRFELVHDAPQNLPPDANATGRTKVIDSIDKPWLSPAGPAGPRISVSVVEHRPMTSEENAEAAGPTATTTKLGDHTVYVHENNLPVKTAAGDWQESRNATLVIHLSETVNINVSGEGFSAAELLEFAQTLELK